MTTLLFQPRKPLDEFEKKMNLNNIFVKYYKAVIEDTAAKQKSLSKVDTLDEIFLDTFLV